MAVVVCGSQAIAFTPFDTMANKCPVIVGYVVVSIDPFLTTIFHYPMLTGIFSPSPL